MKAVQCRMARAALQLGVRELAALAQVSTATITKLERGEALLPRTAEAVQRALEAQGVQFIDNPPGARVEKLKLPPSAKARLLGTAGGRYPPAPARPSDKRLPPSG
jgi:transcriptional regulator with XRE-family HTH domain